MVLGAQWYVLFNVLAGASAIPGDLGEAADVYRVSGPPASPARSTCRPSSPSSSPASSRRPEARGTPRSSRRRSSSAGRELTTFGLGSLITRATHDGNFPLLAAGVLTMSLALVLLNRTVWRRLYRLAATRYALNR